MWQPISKNDFEVLFMDQLAGLSQQERMAFECYRIPIESAWINRSDECGWERVYVVAKSGEGVLYFDDVEYGFNISQVNEDGRIVSPGGSQYSLAEATQAWMLGS